MKVILGHLFNHAEIYRVIHGRALIVARQDIASGIAICYWESEFAFGVVYIQVCEVRFKVS